MKAWCRWVVLAFGVSGSVVWPWALGAQEADGPETVLATFRVKADQLPAFLAMMPEYRKALRARNLANPDPYVLMVGDEDGKPVVYEIFSWKNHHAADHVPVEIQAYWDRMNTMVERRGSHAGIEFPEMRLISPAQ
jgi:hypothetical protein